MFALRITTRHCYLPAHPLGEVETYLAICECADTPEPSKSVLPLHEHTLANGWPPTFPLDPTLSAPPFPDVSWLSLDDPPWVPGSGDDVLQKERALRSSRSKRLYPGNSALPGSHAPLEQLAGPDSMGPDTSNESPVAEEGDQVHRWSQEQGPASPQHTLTAGLPSRSHRHDLAEEPTEGSRRPAGGSRQAHAGTPGQQQESIPSAAHESLQLPAEQHAAVGDQERIGSSPTETSGSEELGSGHDQEHVGSSSTGTSRSEELGSGQQLPRPPLSRLLASPQKAPAQKRKEALQRQDAAWRQQNLNLAGKAGSVSDAATGADNTGEAYGEGMTEAGPAATGMCCSHLLGVSPLQVAIVNKVRHKQAQKEVSALQLRQTGFVCSRPRFLSSACSYLTFSAVLVGRG